MIRTLCLGKQDVLYAYKQFVNVNAGMGVHLLP